jgi:Patatin-like phospholipase
MPTDTPPLLLSRVLEEEFSKLHKAASPTPAAATEAHRLAAIYDQIHALDPKRSALCISGGGIRSATFALGIIQGLARCGLLDKFDYLSTVSGGGYIGSWLTAWTHRHGMAQVIKELTAEPQSPVAPEPAPVTRLRDYSNYLNPKLGLLSADTWTLLATVVRNLVLNWFVLIPLLAAALMIPRVGIPVLQMSVSEPVSTACLVAGSVLLIWAIGYIGIHRPSVKRFRSNQGRFLRLCLIPLLLASIFLITYWAWAGHKRQWDTSFVLNFTSKQIAIREDLFGFIGLGILITLVSFLSGLVFKLKQIRLRTLLEAFIAVVTGAIGGCLVWCAAIQLFPKPLESGTTLLLYVCFSSPLILIALMTAETLFVGLSSYFTDDHDREWWARAGAWVLIYCVIWSAASALLIFGPIGILKLEAELQASIASVGGLSGLITIILGRSPKTPSKQLDEKEQKPSFMALLSKYVLGMAAPLFAIFLTLLIALGAEILFHRSVPETAEAYKNQLLDTTLRNFLIFVIGMALVGVVMGIFININKFSLHAMYRNRLIRAYLGASREDRVPDLFTGFDDNDNIQMHKLWPNQQPLHDGSPKQPFHVINMALNLVAGEKLAWQQRKAESFTVSPLHAGSYYKNVGYRKTEDQAEDGKKIYYGGSEGISLGTAVAISGAAASPNMGYHSSSVVTFLMTLFNARLGWWLGNPGAPGRRTFFRPGPLMAPKPMIDEALGLTDDKNRYVYLSDGGHFENLALYEMVLRRCGLIVLSDAGQDGRFKFGDLGSAVRKIRIDFGIPITFENGIQIYSREQNKKGYYCAIGTIGYSCVDGPGTDGVLVYIKPTFYGTEPADVYQHAQTNKAFPHDSTADQWFDEAQFESYRMLGSHVIKQICGDDKDDAKTDEAKKEPSLDDFVKKIREYLKRPITN